MFGENYLELLGYEPGNAGRRADLWQAPPGLSSLVWKSSEANSEYQHLQCQDRDGDPPASFHLASAEYAQQRFGRLPEDYDGSPGRMALGFVSDDLTKVKMALLSGDSPFNQQSAAILVVTEQGFNLALRFT